MRSRVYGVTVEMSTGRSVEYAWATHIKVDKRWELHIYHGRRQRVYLLAGEWLSHRSFNGQQLAEPGARPQVHLRPVPVEDLTTLMPRLDLDRGWAPVPRL